MKTAPNPVLLIHGGAWAMPDEAVEAHERGIAAALAAGWEALSRGGTAVDAVEAAVTIMEDDDTFDAGRGSFLTRDGRVQCDALLMNGSGSPRWRRGLRRTPPQPDPSRPTRAREVSRMSTSSVLEPSTLHRQNGMALFSTTTPTSSCQREQATACRLSQPARSCTGAAQTPPSAATPNSPRMMLCSHMTPSSRTLPLDANPNLASGHRQP